MKDKYQVALNEVKELLDAMRKEGDDFEYHYFVHCGSIDDLQELVDKEQERRQNQDE
jgi:hypothetical protein